MKIIDHLKMINDMRDNLAWIYCIVNREVLFHMTKMPGLTLVACGALFVAS